MNNERPVTGYENEGNRVERQRSRDKGKGQVVRSDGEE